MRGAAFCTGDSYHLFDIETYFKVKSYPCHKYEGTLHVSFIKGDERADAFIFSYGCVVTWNMKAQHEAMFLKDLQKFSQGSFAKSIADQFEFSKGSETKIHEEEDLIVLESDDTLIKQSFSYGMAQSVKLKAFEASTKKTIEESEKLPKQMAKRGKIDLPAKKISQKLGELLTERNSIILHSDILDTPEFFWKRPRYEGYYLMTSDYLDMDKRLEILNRRLDVIKDLYDALSNELKHLHSSRLEWIIIILIAIEIVVALWKDIFGTLS